MENLATFMLFSIMAAALLSLPVALVISARKYDEAIKAFQLASVRHSEIFGAAATEEKIKEIRAFDSEEEQDIEFQTKMLVHDILLQKKNAEK